MTTEPQLQPEPNSAQTSTPGVESSHANFQAPSTVDRKPCQCCSSSDDMIATLTDIREFMRSAMKSMGLSVPERNIEKKDLPTLRPNEDKYTEKAVLDFWLERLPLAPRLQKSCADLIAVIETTENANSGPSMKEDVQSFLSSFSFVNDLESKAGNIVRKRSDMSVEDREKLCNSIRAKWPKTLGEETDKIEFAIKSPLKVLFYWKFTSAGLGSTSHILLGTYDEDGYPTRGTSQEILRTFSISISFARKMQKLRNSYIVRQSVNSPNSIRLSEEFQMFSATWTINHPGDVLTIDCLAFLLSQFAPASEIRLHFHSPIISFIRQYTGDWPPRNITKHHWISFNVQQKVTFMQYHLRVFSPLKDDETQLNPDSIEGIRSRRQNGSLSSLSNKTDTPIIERRLSLVLNSTYNMEFPVYVVVKILNSTALDYNSVDRKCWANANIRPCVEFTGLAAFQFEIHNISDLWAQAWGDLLDYIDSVLLSEVGDVLNPKERRNLMFDNDSFSRSELYFTILQLLRISLEWINGSFEDLEGLAELSQAYLSNWAGGRDGWNIVLRENWNNVISHQRGLGKALISRINSKTEEVKSLRDGLFNATAVREAAKSSTLASESSTLNHYILVFTVMTIVYLPLSFTAGLFALNLFQLEQPHQKKAFIVTIVLVALSTYFISGFLIWVVRKEERRQLFRHWWESLQSLTQSWKTQADESTNAESRSKAGNLLFDKIRQITSFGERPNAAPQDSDSPSGRVPQDLNV